MKEPNVAGSFYPAEKGALQAMIGRYLEEASVPPEAPQDPLVLVVPHAGYVYSGPVAAYGFKSIRGKSYDTVVVIAPSHHYPFQGAAVYRQGVFRTPLGDVPVDSPTVDALMAADPAFVHESPQVFEGEHALEVELPFLQTVLRDLRIVPVLMGAADAQDLKAMGQALAAVLKDKHALVVISTDLSHYNPYKVAQALDQSTVAMIVAGDTQGLAAAESAGGGNACGWAGVLAGMYYAQACGNSKGVLLKYANSGDTAGDKSRVVGYASIAFSRGPGADPVPGARGEERPKEEKGRLLTGEEERKLLSIARRAISDQLAGGRVEVARRDEPGLNLRRGAFVTLHNHGRLRGCIGFYTSQDPLYLTVATLAIGAATQDHRFEPVTADELKDIGIEISVLTQPQPIDDWKKIRLGTDGVIVRRGSSSGVFLPQVATETGWDLAMFLSELCAQKAGLPRDAYRDPATKLLTFQAYVFGEEKYK
ncbi:MAG: AmmeMemoRadiSam system protein B [Deltaproteobacteria bacterium]